MLPKSTLTILAYRNLQASPSAGAGLHRHRRGDWYLAEFFREARFQCGGRLSNDTYVANTEATDATRVDNFFFFRPKISDSFMKYVRSSISYEYRANDSTILQDSWLDNQMNFELSLDF
jgi:hypothetical protein